MWKNAYVCVKDEHRMQCSDNSVWPSVVLNNFLSCFSTANNNVLVHVGTSRTGGVALSNSGIAQLSIVSPVVSSKAYTAQTFAFMPVSPMGFIHLGSVSNSLAVLEVIPTGMDVISNTKLYFCRKLIPRITGEIKESIQQSCDWLVGFPGTKVV